ncbi:hypothetical protein [Sulfitobacter guttiformis]|uniref:Uncharacterized protein n=1 Tax=Sulfitobacter guttiformis TaxID=74349 RepID=A0A420DMX0_9RHOB|nr:hypothetical protein [Sulfitobacter guttiformis]KIN72837.1 hypothetical protein Z949_2017 [Sulfitobacter guttiformis KCTC 32187]RKE95528.1 hypothetical protein C8N30_0063 [Sulfitobacter guttiformis]
MSKKQTIALTGIALVGTLFLIERATSSVTLIPANVVSVAQIPANDGPDQWTVTFELSSRDVFETQPRYVRPDLSLGDPICVAARARSWATTRYDLTGQTSCWIGAVTPLRGP